MSWLYQSPIANVQVVRFVFQNAETATGICPLLGWSRPIGLRCPDLMSVAELDLTPSEVAKKLRVSPAKVRAWIERGELTAFNVADRIGGRPRWRITPEAFAERGRRREARLLGTESRPYREDLPSWSQLSLPSSQKRIKWSAR
jgi:excisionase family DNA binding protein